MTAGSATDRPTGTLLLVDDNPANLQVLVRSLDGRGHRLLVAKDGETALNIARRVQPDLVLLDVLMPGLGGFDVCRALKAHPTTSDAPVIFLSALGDVADKVAGLALGAVDYVTKPIRPEEVVARVDSHLARYRLTRELRRNHRQLDRELSDAAEMQRLLLPRSLPQTGRLAFAAHYRTSQHAGGDYYDVIPIGNDVMAVIVADVSGHGARAAIVMAMLRTLLHVSAIDLADPPAVLRFAQEHFRFLRDTGIFATAIYAVVDLRAGTMRMVCAGHPPPLLCRRGDEVTPLPCEAVPPLMLFDLPSEVACATHRLMPGDRVLFYTDGVIDRESPAGVAYDTERLIRALGASAGEPPKAALWRVVDDLEAFAGGGDTDDDNTLLLMDVNRATKEGARP
jgi:sigma-B regulation protein RsbU (phosphoserine phosphatase)